MRHIRLVLDINETGYWPGTRHRARLEHFVRVIKEYAEDDGKKSLLQGLSIGIAHNGKERAYDQQLEDAWRETEPFRCVEKYMFALESLCLLMHIPKVSVTGVPEWFGKCLEKKIKGMGGDVTKTVWPATLGNGKQQPGTARKWYQPVYEWREFAAKNGVEMPEGADGFWEVE